MIRFRLIVEDMQEAKWDQARKLVSAAQVLKSHIDGLTGNEIKDAADDCFTEAKKVAASKTNMVANIEECKAALSDLEEELDSASEELERVKDELEELESDLEDWV